jgi:tripartite ATP-independent transporter DctP family solute receptor
MFKQIVRSFVFVAVLLGLCVGGNIAMAKTVIKFSIGANDGPGGEINGMKAFKKYVEAKSGGEIEVRLFFNTMGGSLQLTEAVKNGTLEMCLTDDSVLGSFHKPMQVFQIPYLFPSSPVAWRFTQSDFVRDLTDGMREATGLRTLTFSENGFRNLTNNKRVIKTPDDLKGLKMRTMQSPVYVNFMKSMGAGATPIAWPELMGALKQGVVDGQENAASTIWDGKLYEVQKYMSVNEHIYGLHLLVINEQFFQSLSADHQKIIMDGAKMHSAVANAQKSMDNLANIDKIKGAGMVVHVTTPSEKEQFRKVSQDAVKEYIAEQVGSDLVNRLMSAVDKTVAESYQ